MARPKHRIKAAGAYFINAETWQRRALFNVETTAMILIEVMLAYRDKGSYLLHDFVVMPDHLHMILTPSHDTTLEKALQLIKGGSSFRIGKALRMKFPVWQPGFRDHLIRSLDDYKRCKCYLEQNPVKARLSDTPSDYLLSSASGRYPLDAFEAGWPSGAKALEG